MARYMAGVESTRAPEDVFAYLSDFSTAAEWDPGVVEAQLLGEGPVGMGTRFRLVAVFMGRRTTLEYEVVEFDPPRSITFRGENATAISLDRLVFEPTAAGTRVVYDADLRFKGAWKAAEPLFALAFRRVGDRALEGMRRTIGT